MFLWVTRGDKKDTLFGIIDQLQYLTQNTLFIGSWLHSPTNETTKYIYHLSDDTNHNCVFTFCVVEDVILNHPEVIEQGILVLWSDNCEEQYKNRKTFYVMKLRSITSRSTGIMELLDMGGVSWCYVILWSETTTETWDNYEW